MSLEDEKLVRVFEAGSEIEAISISSMLKGEGIEAAVENIQIPAYGTIAMAYKKVWGYVLVLESDEEKAREIIDALSVDFHDDLEDIAETEDTEEGEE
ncbi:MAG: DUF2007 domain-containing protein [Candidatus Fermentibacteraceae bacterium]